MLRTYSVYLLAWWTRRFRIKLLMLSYSSTTKVDVDWGFKSLIPCSCDLGSKSCNGYSRKGPAHTELKDRRRSRVLDGYTIKDEIPTWRPIARAIHFVDSSFGTKTKNRWRNIIEVKIWGIEKIDSLMENHVELGIDVGSNEYEQFKG